MYPEYSVLALRSSTSIDGKPHMSSSISLHVKMLISSGGINSWKPSLKASICSRIAFCEIERWVRQCGQNAGNAMKKRLGSDSADRTQAKPSFHKDGLLRK